ncbi:MAG: sigma-70 factor domain-containing protein, partial [Acidimicrobiales bacterium]
MCRDRANQSALLAARVASSCSNGQRERHAEGGPLTGQGNVTAVAGPREPGRGGGQRDALGDYLAQLGAHRLLSRAEESELAERISRWAGRGSSPSRRRPAHRPGDQDVANGRQRPRVSCRPI